MYQNYIFDLYGTLADIHTDEEREEAWEKLRLFYGFYGACYGPGELRAAYHRLAAEEEKRLAGAKARDAGGEAEPGKAHESHPEIRLEPVFHALFTEKGVEAEESLALHAGQFFRVLSIDWLRLYEGVPELLGELRRRGKGVFLLSNAQRMFTEYELNDLGIAPYFDGILISSDWGVRKPDPRFFRQLLKEYSLDPGECLMVGNDGICDIAGAGRVGMDTCYIHSNLSPEEDREVGATYRIREIGECLLL